MLSALPVVGLTALSKSDLGKQVQVRGRSGMGEKGGRHGKGGSRLSSALTPEVGARWQVKLEAELPQLEQEAAAQRAGWQAAMSASPYFGEGRPTWPALLGGPAPHLRGDQPGDFGFDPLGLAVEDEARAKFTEYEVSCLGSLCGLYVDGNPPEFRLNFGPSVMIEPPTNDKSAENHFYGSNSALNSN